MKSSLKLSVVFFVSISLLLACSFLLLNAKAEVSLQKISLGNNAIRIQTDKAISVIDVQLLENTDHCLTDCYAILRIHPYQTINLPAEANAEFAWNFVKEKPWMDGLVSHHFELLETVEYKVEVPEYGKALVNTTCYNEQNESYACETEQAVQTGSHEETRYKDEYKPFAFWGETLEADKDYTIKLVGKKRAKLGTNNVDWIPTMKGIGLNEWEWWNSTWNKCRKITNTSSVNLPANYQVRVSFGNSTIPYADFMPGAQDVRFTNGTDCNDDGGTALPAWNETSNTSDISKNLTFWVKIPSNNTAILMYYNASGVPINFSASSVMLEYDSFEDGDSTSGLFQTGTNYVDSDFAQEGIYSLKLTNIDAWECTKAMAYPIGGTAAVFWVRASTVVGTESVWLFTDSGSPCSVNWPDVGVQLTFSNNISYVNSSGVWVTTPIPVSANTFERMEIIFLNSTHFMLRTSDANSYLTLDGRYSVSNVDMIHLLGHQSGVSHWWDNFFLRQWSATEPSWSIGNEETYSEIMNITIYSPQNITYNTSSIDLNWSATKNLNWSVYSLNGGSNVSLFAGEFDYINNFSTTDENSFPMGITQNGTYFWITDDYPKDVLFKYWMNNGTFVENGGFNISECSARPRGITQNGTYFWIVDGDKRIICKYWMNGTYINNFSIANEIEGTDASGLANDETYLWVTKMYQSSSKEEIYKYWTDNGTYSGQSLNLSSSSTPIDITLDDTFFWISDYNNKEVDKYWLNGSYTGKTFHINTTSVLRGITNNGTDIWVMSQQNYGTVLRYQQYGTKVNTTISSDDGIVENSNNVTICATASDNGELSCETRYFTVDTILPQISLTFPENGQAYNVTSISITGTASDTNYDIVRINDSRFGVNLGTYQNWNFTNISMAKGWYSVKITANDTAGNENSTEVYFKAGPFDVTFNIYSGETGENLTSVNVNCNNSWFGTIDSYDSVEFEPGWWSCEFSRANYYSKTKMFFADSDKTVDVILSYQKDMTIQEHNWLEAIYDCLYTGDCLALNLLLNINETTEKTWNQFKRTDQTIVSNEDFISTVVNATNNITINYTINVPTKEGYGIIEGIQGYDDFLPIRVHYWFLDENNKTCYSQGNYSVALAEPYCQPLTVYTVGQINTTIDFMVDLRPSLPAGTYNIVRSIEIDPDNVWVGYGQEIIGQIRILETEQEPLVDVRGSGKIIDEGSAKTSETAYSEESQQAQQDKTTGMMTTVQVDNLSYAAVIISAVTLVLVGLIYKNSRKRNP